MTQRDYLADVYYDRREQQWRAVIRDERGSTTIVFHRKLNVLREFLDRAGIVRCRPKHKEEILS